MHTIAKIITQHIFMYKVFLQIYVYIEPINTTPMS
jgi:hypothetical protein